MRLLIVLALAGALVTSQDPSGNSGTIEGTVMRFGTADPIANVVITLGPEWSVAEAVTDSNGRFILRDVTPGQHTIRAWRAGYVNPAPEGVSLKDGGNTRKVTVSAGQSAADANLTLAPAAVIAGRILDISGKPAVEAQILLWREGGGTLPVLRSQTNDRGAYRVIGLEAGRYSVAAMTKETVDSLGFEFPDPAMVLTYYPGKAEEADATLVDVEEGKVVENVDFRIQPSQRGARHKVSGKLISRTGFSGRRITDLYLVPRFRGKPKDTPTHSNGGAFATAQLNAAFRSDATSFDFAFGDVREGAYDLFIETGRSSGEDCCDVVARLALNVYGDIDGLIVEAGGVDVRGRIVQRDGASVGPAVSVSLALVPEDIRTRNVKPGASGEFTMPAVLPGAWKVLASGLPPEFTVFDIRQKDESVVDGGVVVTDRSAEPFEVILTAAGSVEGSVRGAEGAAIIGADVVLIPTGANETRTALYRRARSDGAGRFSVASVGMGDYAALAFRRGLLPSDAVSGPSLKSFAAPYLPLAIAISVRPGAPTSLTVPVAQQPVDPR